MKFKTIRKTLVGKLIFNEYIRMRGLRNMRKFSDYEFIRREYAKWKIPELGGGLNLAEPRRYTEKLQWLKLFWRDDLARVCSDKYEVRSYVEQAGYAEILNDLYGVYEDEDDIDFNALPERFVAKGTHGCGWNLIVKNKKEVNWFWWKKIMHSWLKQNLYWYGREWVYEEQTPRIIIEKYLEDDSGGLRDFKVHCFNGEPRYILLIEDRHISHKRSFCDCDGNFLPFQFVGNDEEHVSYTPSDPVRQRMLQIARDLSRPFPAVRVDFYECGGKIYFGEMTFFTGCGYLPYTPDEWNFINGDMITLPEPNHNLALYEEIQRARK